LTSFGYGEEHILLFQMRPGEGEAPAGRAKLNARVDWLECRDICIPGRADLSMVLPLRPRPEPDSVGAAQLRDAEDTLPRTAPLPAAGAVAEGDTVRLILPGRQPGADFIPSEIGAFESGAPSSIVTAASTEIRLTPGATGTPRRVAGILFSPGRVPLLIDVPVESGNAGLRHLGLAFLGGLLLNLMPCVFPVLSLKVMGLLNRSRSGGGAAMQGVAYAAGVFVCFESLAMALLAARSAGSALGWGFHMQSPLLVGALALLFAAFGLNMLGAFEIGGGWFGRAAALASGEGLTGSFLSGVFAVIVAAPCTAPFMGAALGWALVQPAPRAFAVFAALAAGNALPYAALSAWPSLLRRLPRPGPWMDVLKKTMSVPLFATAAWLLWVLWRLLAPPIASDMFWTAWSAPAVAQARAERKTVFVDFTASWCLTCQVNERVVFTQAPVRAAMSRARLFRADWTNRDPAIAAELAAHGRSGVPLYLVYPRGGAPVVLPELLTPDIVLESLSTPDTLGGSTP
jgi:thiol:disulfide interchange protein DsbD